MLRQVQLSRKGGDHEEEERRRDNDGDERISTIYRPDVRFAYRVDDRNYATDTWKLGGGSTWITGVVKSMGSYRYCYN